MNTVIGIEPAADSTARMYLPHAATAVLVLELDGVTLSVRAAATPGGPRVLAAFCLQLAGAAEKVAAALTGKPHASGQEPQP